MGKTCLNYINNLLFDNKLVLDWINLWVFVLKTKLGLRDVYFKNING